MIDDGAVPGPDGTPWLAAAPEAVGLDPAALARAVAFAAARETPWPRDLQAHIEAGGLALVVAHHELKLPCNIRRLELNS